KIYKEDVIDVVSHSAVPRGYNPCYTGRDVTRYNLQWGNLACRSTEEARCGGCWDAEKHRGKNKLLTRQIGRWPEYALDPDGFDCLNTIFMVNVSDPSLDPFYLLGVL